MTWTWRWIGVVVVVFVVWVGSARADQPSAPIPPNWQSVRFELVDVAAKTTPYAIEVTPDGRVVFAGEDMAETVAKAPPVLISKIAGWATKGPAASPGAPKSFGVRVRLRTVTAREATYDSDHLPALERELYAAASELINSPRTPLPCAPWKGQGAFTLTSISQNFGTAPGPVIRVVVKSDGTAQRSVERRASGAPVVVETSKTTTVSTAEIAALRDAIVKVDLNSVDSVFGGGGNGSNLRLVRVDSTAGTCARAATNALPAKLQPLLDALAPITARLAK